MITPVNGHLLIEPLKHESFISTHKDTFEEIGVVISVSTDVPGGAQLPGQRVYFDSWLAVKYPKGDEGFYWLVKWDDVRAVEYAESTQVPEQHLSE